MADRPVIALLGAAGFIGSHTTTCLSSLGARLRLLAGAENETRRVLGVAPELCVTADITDRAALDELVHGAATVVHAAGPPSVADSFANPIEFVRTHTLGTTAVLDACARANVSRVVYISSAEVYGNTTAPFASESQPLTALSPYGAAKIGAEQVVRAFAAGGEIDTFILRPFCVYGPGMSPRGVVAEILERAKRSERIIVGDTRPIRDFCFVSDVAKGIATACFAPVSGCSVVNLGSGVGTSIGDLASLISELAHSPGVEECRRNRSQRIDVSCLVADTARARELLSWKASTPLRDGLTKTLEWLRGA